MVLLGQVVLLEGEVHGCALWLVAVASGGRGTVRGGLGDAEVTTHRVERDELAVDGPSVSLWNLRR